MLSFRVERWVQIQGRWAACVKPDKPGPMGPIDERGYETPPEPLFPKVRLDMEEYETDGIDRFASPRWYALGFAIMIKGEPKNRWDLPQPQDTPEQP